MENRSSPELFEFLNLSVSLNKALKDLNFKRTTEIQRTCIPYILNGHDLIAQSKTGSGKTAAFGLPILQQINLNLLFPQALILCPTRELSLQVIKDIQKFSKYMKGLKSLHLIGGQPIQDQIKEARQGIHLIVGTPGRVHEFFKSQNINLENLKFLVLDEADRLLDEAFIEETKLIMNQLPTERQTLFFSATFPESMTTLSLQFQKNPKEIYIKTIEKGIESIEQLIYEAEKPDKLEMLLQILKNHPSECTLIFCRTKIAVNEIGQCLKSKLFKSDILHADLKQADRERVIHQFRKGHVKILIATDIAARGLDIDILNLVINYDLPSSSDIYIHRIGRTGRAGRRGTAVSIMTDYEKDFIKEIQSKMGHEIKFVSGSSAGLSNHLTDLSINKK